MRLLAPKSFAAASAAWDPLAMWAAPAGSSAGASRPALDLEIAKAPGFHVRIVAHASPRWRSASAAAEADRRNLELSQRRAETVRRVVDEQLRRYLGQTGVSGPSADFGIMVEVRPGTAEVSAEPRGSIDTLRDAKGARSNDDQQGRRVDVIIGSSQKFSGLAVTKGRLMMMSTLTTSWHVSVDMSAGGSLGAAAAYLKLTLTNDKSKQSMKGTVMAGGGGPKASLGTSASIWSDPTRFTTDDPLTFEDFEGNWIRYSTVGVNIFIGYEKARLSFSGLGSGAQDLDVGGWNAGTLGVGGASLTGPLSLDGTYPPTDIPIEGSDILVQRYERTARGEDLHKVLFATGSDKLTDSERGWLALFLESVVASRL